MKNRRIITGLLALALVAGACAKKEVVPTGPKSGKYGDPNAPEKSPTAKAASPAATGGAPASGSTGSKKPTSKSTSGGGGSTAAPVAKEIQDEGPNGSKSIGFPVLGNSAYTTINLEVDWVAGREPSEAAKTHMANLLKRESGGKPVTFNGGNQLPPQGGNYDNDKIVRIQRAHRQVKSIAPVASFWVGYLDGSVRGGGAAGVAWEGTIATVFMDTIDGLPFPQTTRDQIEKTIFVQEIAHLMGLINIGYKSPRDHADPNSPHHSKNPNSVMYYALMTEEGIIPFITNGGSPPTDFDADDRADLKDIREGRL